MNKTRVFAAALTMVGIVSFARDARAEFNYTGSSAGFEVSLVVPDAPHRYVDLHPTFGAGGLLDFNFSLGDAGDLSIRPNIELWLSGDDRVDYDLVVFETSFNGDFRYYFPLPDRIRVRPFVGNGLGIVLDFQNWDYDNARIPDEDDSDTDLGTAFHFLTGVDFPMGARSTGFGELKFKLGRYDVFRLSFGMMFAL